MTDLLQDGTYSWITQDARLREVWRNPLLCQRGAIGVQLESNTPNFFTELLQPGLFSLVHIGFVPSDNRTTSGWVDSVENGKGVPDTACHQQERGRRLLLACHRPFQCLVYVL